MTGVHMSGHSRFAPSSAHRVVTCPASLLLSEKESDQPTYDAVLGTVAHWVHEHWLLTGKRPDHLIGKRPWSFMAPEELRADEWQIVRYAVGTEQEIVVDETMLNFLEESVLRCMELPGDRYVEQRVDISPWCPKVDEHGEPMPKQGGTADFFVCAPGHLDISDLKYGVGVQVYAERNFQAVKYALGVINEYGWMYDFETVTIRINQPRLGHFDVWHTTVAELLEIGAYILSRYEIALQPNPPFEASEKGCQFCKIKHKCGHLAEKVLSHFDFEEDATREDVALEAAFLSQERMVEIWKMRGLFKLWIGAIEGELEAQLKRDPKSVPGLRLVNGRSFRQWKNEKAAEEELLFLDVPEEKIYEPRKLLSPAKAEKLLPRKLRPAIEELVIKPLGEPVVVDADDKRPDYRTENEATAHAHFSDESDEFGD